MSKTEESKPKNIKKESRRSKKHAHESGGEIPQLSDVKKERGARKTTFAESKNGMEEGAEPMRREKELHSEIEKSKEAKSRRSCKDRKSKIDKAADVDNDNLFATEVLKPEKSEKQSGSKKGTEQTASHLKGGSKKKIKSSKKKCPDVQPAYSCGTNGLSTMIEPWILLKTVIKDHREAVHAVKDIMDLQATKTGDRTMLDHLEKLLTQIDREKSFISMTSQDDPSLSM